LIVEKMPERLCRRNSGDFGDSPDCKTIGDSSLGLMGHCYPEFVAWGLKQDYLARN
jgi:hypothetical protein